ncbi:MAG TPA: hypothetical protein VIL08_01680 [Limnochorda sp.]
MLELALLVGVLLVGAALGFWWGERVGARSGWEVGQAAAALQLRQEGLKAGRCQLCGAASPAATLHEAEAGPEA